jgi:hypothetical protein
MVACSLGTPNSGISTDEGDTMDCDIEAVLRTLRTSRKRVHDAARAADQLQQTIKATRQTISATRGLIHRSDDAIDRFKKWGRPERLQRRKSVEGHFQQ